MEFNALTDNECADGDSVDPKLVARWQVEHGVPPDGRVGTQTLRAARRAGGRHQRLQRKATSEVHAEPDVHAVAAAGISGAGSALPHLDAVQRSFGPEHDLSQVKSHSGSQAAAAAGAIGAEAYATGDHVAFASTSPDLHTAAHEAAHVVQQRGGVQLKGGVGQAGDQYEQHADAIADAVVAGRSAAALLGAEGGVASAAGPPVQLQAADVPDVSRGEIRIRRAWEAVPIKVGPAEGKVSIRAEGALKERSADNQIDGSETKASFGNRQAVHERKRTAQGDADKAVEKVSTVIKTNLAQISDPEPLELLHVPGVDLVLKRDVKALEAKMDVFEGDVDVSLLTVTFAGEASLAPLLSGLLPDDSPFAVEGVLRAQLELRISAETVNDLLKLRKAKKDLEEVASIKTRHAATKARIAELEDELADRKRRKVPLAYPEVYDRGLKMERELEELRRNEGKLAKLSHKADEVLGKASAALEKTKTKIAKKLGNAAERAVGKAAKRALEKGLSKVLAKAIPIYNAISTAQDIYEVAEFMASVDWAALLSGKSGEGGTGTSGSTEDGPEVADGGGVENGAGTGEDGTGAGTGQEGSTTDPALLAPVTDPFVAAPHHPAAQKIVDAIMTGSVQLGSNEHELLDMAIPKDLTDNEVAQIIAVVTAEQLASESANGATIVENVIKAVQAVRAGDFADVNDREPENEVTPAAARERGPTRPEAKPATKKDHEATDEVVDLAPDLEQLFRVEGDRIERVAKTLEVGSMSFEIIQHVTLENSLTTEGGYLHLEVTLLVTRMRGKSAVIETHVPNQPLTTARTRGIVVTRIMIIIGHSESQHNQSSSVP